MSFGFVLKEIQVSKVLALVLKPIFFLSDFFVIIIQSDENLKRCGGHILN
jgi:hypothetical protein